MSTAFSDFLAYSVWRVLGSPDDHAPTVATCDAWDILANGWPPYPEPGEVASARKAFVAWFARYAKAQHHKAEVTNQGKSIASISPIDPKEAAKLRVKPDPDFHLRRPIVPWIIRARDLIQAGTEDELLARRNLRGIADVPQDLNQSPTSRTHITEMAVRTLGHWTDTLEFLASTRIDPLNPTQVYLDDPDSSIIDSFNQHLTRGKQPNIIHNLLARLSRSLRSRLILTTNFDTLLEDAFIEQKESLHSIPISTKGNLPAYATVRAQDCLIKLHGDLLETRADSSINKPPSPVDRRRFYQYLRGPARPHRREPVNFVQSNLLVLGYSANDARCVQLMKHVLDLDPDFRIFWVCHNNNDLLHVSKLFSDYIPQNCATEAEFGSKCRFHLVVTDRTDLLLWELYQALNLSLPGGGYHFKFTHLVPPVHASPEVPPDSDERPKPSSDRAKLVKRFLKKTNLRKRKSNRGQIDCIDYESGMARHCRQLFNDLAHERIKTLWFELEDHRHPIMLLWDILGAIALRQGSFQAEAVNFLPAELIKLGLPKEDTSEEILDQVFSAIERRLRLFVARYKIEPSSWALFLYGRNGPGGCSGWTTYPTYWPEGHYNLLLRLLQHLANSGFRILYLPFGGERMIHNQTKIGQFGSFLKRQSFCNVLTLPTPSAAYPTRLLSHDYACPELPLAQTHCPLSVTTAHQVGDTKDPLIEKMIKQSRSHAGSTFYISTLEAIADEFLGVGVRDFDPKRRASRMLWLYGLSLFRQSRHSAAMISEAVLPCLWKFNSDGRDNDEYRYKLVFGGLEQSSNPADPVWDEIDLEGWSNWLEKKGLFLKKPGGFTWKYRNTRLALQHFLELMGPVTIPANFPPATAPSNNHEPILGRKHLWGLRARIHYWIADWYLRAFHSSGHYTPLVECMYHCAQSIQLAKHYAPVADAQAASLSKITSGRIELCWAATCLLRRALKQGSHCFHYWCPGVDISKFFLDDLRPLYDSVIPLASDAPKNGLGKLLISHFAPRGVIDREIDHLTRSVIAEGYANLTKPTPFVASSGYKEIPEAGPGPLQVSTPSLAAAELKYTETGWGQMKSDSENAEGSELDPDEWLEQLPGKIEALFRVGLTVDTLLAEIDDSADLAAATQTNPSGPELRGFHRLMRRLRFDWSRRWERNGTDPTLLFNLVWDLSSNTYHILRCAKLDYHLNSIQSEERKEDQPISSVIAKEHWQMICVIAYHSLQLCRLLPPDYEREERELRVRILSTYGLALGCLGRGSEANRRLNEAHALALHRATEDLPLQLARIHLRRCEVCLYRFLDELPRDGKRCWAHLDDAWTAVERAERALSGKNHSSFWYYRLAVSKLSCLAALSRGSGYAGVAPSASLPMRRRQHLESEIEHHLMEALFAAEGDRFRELRAAGYALEASQMRVRLDDPERPPSFLAEKLVSASDKEPFQRLQEVLNTEVPESKPLDAYRRKLHSDYGLAGALEAPFPPTHLF